MISILFLLVIAFPASAQLCPGCVHNSAAPENAQFNVSSATVRGQLSVGTLNMSSFTATSVTASSFSGNGSGLTNLNASSVASGNVSSNSVVGPYPGITQVGTLGAGTWDASLIGTQYGGTGQNFVSVSSGSLIYFSGNGVMSTLLYGTPEAILQTNGAGAAPSWTSAPQVSGRNIYGVPLSALSSGTLPTSITVSTNSIPFVNGTSVIGNISGSAGSFTGPIQLSQLSTGTLPTSVAASSVTVTGVIPGTYGNSSFSPQLTIRADGRVYSSTQVPVSISANQLNGGTIPMSVTVPLAILSEGTLSTGTVVSSIAATGVVPGTYGSPSVIPGYTVGADGRLYTVSTQTISIPASSINSSISLSQLSSGTLSSNIVASSVANSGVSPSTYGGAMSSPQITVGPDGRITSAMNVPITGGAPSGPASGSLAGSYPNPSIAPSGVTAATYGGISGTTGNIPVITIGSDGRVSNATSQAFSIPSGSNTFAITNGFNNWISPQTSVSSWTFNGGVLVTTVTANYFIGNAGGLTNIPGFSNIPNSTFTWTAPQTSVSSWTFNNGILVNTITATTLVGLNNGGDVTVEGGPGNFGGTVTVRGADSSGGADTGGDVDIFSGAATGGSTSGSINETAGSGGSIGGSINESAGSGYSLGGNLNLNAANSAGIFGPGKAGSVSITAGNGTLGSSGGSIVETAGLGASSGSVVLNAGGFNVLVASPTGDVLIDTSPDSGFSLAVGGNVNAVSYYGDGSHLSGVSGGSSSPCAYGAGANSVVCISTNTNVSTGLNSVVSGGISNSASGDDSIVVGGNAGTSAQTGSVVVGGGLDEYADAVGNQSRGGASFAGAGIGVSALGDWSFVGDGYNNTASGSGSSVVGGGRDENGHIAGNSAQGGASFIGDGLGNIVFGDLSSVVGGWSNQVNGFASVIAGGGNDESGSQNPNISFGGASFIGAGIDNTANGDYGSTVGGSSNSAGGYGFTGGGSSNQSSFFGDVVAGGGLVIVSSVPETDPTNQTTVAHFDGDFSGLPSPSVTGTNAFIPGKFNLALQVHPPTGRLIFNGSPILLNISSGSLSFWIDVGTNTENGAHSAGCGNALMQLGNSQFWFCLNNNQISFETNNGNVITGPVLPKSSWNLLTVNWNSLNVFYLYVNGSLFGSSQDSAHPNANKITLYSSDVYPGIAIDEMAIYSSSLTYSQIAQNAGVLGGAGNVAIGGDSSVGGGAGNFASGAYSSIPGGSYNVASGTFSFAAGQQAQATSGGSFVWSDSESSPYVDNGQDTFNLRAQGGFYSQASTYAFSNPGASSTFLSLSSAAANFTVPVEATSYQVNNQVAFSSVPVFHVGSTLDVSLTAGTTFFSFIPDSAVSLTRLTMTIQVAGVGGSGDSVFCNDSSGNAISVTSTAAATAGTVTTATGVAPIGASDQVFCHLESGAATKPDFAMSLEYVMQ